MKLINKNITYEYKANTIVFIRNAHKTVRIEAMVTCDKRHFSVLLL